MKTRESGMPEEDLWSSFFAPKEVLARLALTGACNNVVDLGCGYGTFTIPAARVVGGVVYALDIEPEMVAATAQKAAAGELRNVRTDQRDFIAEGTGLPDNAVDYVMLFNLLHSENPLHLLYEARRILHVGGLLGIVHWNYDPATPRGPSMDIRPRPEQCRQWAEQAGFHLAIPEMIDLPPYHYGWVMEVR